MATRDTLWTCVGITSHTGANGKEVVKVRFGVDLARRIKSSQSKSYVKSRGERLIGVRADFVQLPEPMLKLAALQYALGAPEFQSPEDQALIQEAIDTRVPRVKTERKQRSPKKADISLDAIKTRKRRSKVSAEQVLAAVVSDEKPTTVETQ